MQLPAFEFRLNPPVTGSFDLTGPSGPLAGAFQGLRRIQLDWGEEFRRHARDATPVGHRGKDPRKANDPRLRDSWDWNYFSFRGGGMAFDSRLTLFTTDKEAPSFLFGHRGKALHGTPSGQWWKFYKTKPGPGGEAAGTMVLLPPDTKIKIPPGPDIGGPIADKALALMEERIVSDLDTWATVTMNAFADALFNV